MNPNGLSERLQNNPTYLLGSTARQFDLADGWPAEAAGEFTNKRGKVTELNNRPGCYSRQGQEPKPMYVQHSAFSRHGVS